MNSTDRLPVILEAQAWETIMRVLADAPYRISAPLIGEIQAQCMAHQQQPLALVPRDDDKTAAE